MTKLFINIIFLILISLSVRGQQNAQIPDSSFLKSVELSEIVIKASKDNVTYKTIPASVSVLSSSVLRNNEVRSLSDISSTAPNFYMPDYGSKLTSPVYIRGIGSRINSPSVGLYVDYVPYFEKSAFDFDFFDVTRVEVLRGPQGTLFGRNTMGGIVNIVTISPMDYQGSHVNLSMGNYGTYSVNAGNYGKIGDKFGYSLAGNYIHNDGFFSNVHTGKRVDNLNSYGFRNRMIYEVSKKFTIENIASYENSSQGGYPYAIYNATTGKTGSVNYDRYSSYSRELFSDALLMKYSGKGYEILATTAYQYLHGLQSIDQDFTPASLYWIVQKEKQNMISQEIVARSKGNARYSWLTGVYGFYQAFNNSVDADVYAQKMNYVKTYDHKIDGYAFYHQSTLNDILLKGLAITAGIRIDAEKDLMRYQYDRTLNKVFANLADTLYPSLKSLEIIPKLALNYKTGSTNIYAVVARGYKTGGFNTTFERPEDLTFRPEYSWNYEAGLRSGILNNLVSGELAFFYIDWKDQQIYQTVPSGRGSMLKNAGHSVSKGAELSLRLNKVKGYEFMLSYGYTHATFISYEMNETTSYNGKYLPYVPKNTLSLQGSKTIDIRNSRFLDYIKASAVYRAGGDIYWNEGNSVKQPFYGILDAKLSFAKKWLQFDIWAKNITQTEYNAFYFEALGNKYAQSGKPFQTGINLSVKF